MELKWKTCVRAGVTILALYALIHYWSAFAKVLGTAIGAALPLFLGCAIAYVVNILMSFFERHFFKNRSNAVYDRLRRPFSMLLSYVCIALFAVFIVCMIVPELISCVRVLIVQFPKALESSYQWLEENVPISGLFQEENNLFANDALNLKENVTKAFQFLFTGVGGAMGAAFGIVTTLFLRAMTFLIAVIFSIYILSGKETIGRQLSGAVQVYLPDRLVKRLLYVLRTLDASFHSFIVGQCTEALILGGLCMGGMLLLHLPYAAMVGCLIGFTALIPVAGAYIGGIVGAFMIFTVSPVKAVIFIVFLVILQQLEDNLIYPRVVGSSVGLPGIWVLAAITIGGGVLGVVGMLLGVPLAAALYRLLKEDAAERKRANKKTGE